MRANLMTALRQPLETRDVPDPRPGPGQVRIRMRATGVCGTDVYVLSGELPVPLPTFSDMNPSAKSIRLAPVSVPSGPVTAWALAGSRPDAADVRIARRNKSNSARNPKPGSLTAAATPIT
jgi:hypothetical protein